MSVLDIVAIYIILLIAKLVLDKYTRARFIQVQKQQIVDCAIEMKL